MHKLMKAAAAAVSGVALTFSAVVAAEVPASAASSCNTTFSSYKTIKKGASGSQARAAQCLLRSAGYRIKVDGSFSSADAGQLKKFQRKNDVNVTGSVYASSWTALLSRGSRPTLKPGSKGAAVKRLQNSLTASGRHVSATGSYGSATANAVKSVQRAKGLRVNGVANVSVWNLLQNGDPVVKVKKAAKKKKNSSSSSSKAAKAVAFARKQLGDRYRYGASGPSSWDCSGLTAGAWKSAGVKLPHSARQQYKKGKKVSRSNLKSGDLVFFYSGISHVGIYVGGGKIIHASRPGKPVEYSKISYMPYQGARRVG